MIIHYYGLLFIVLLSLIFMSYFIHMYTPHIHITLTFLGIIIVIMLLIFIRLIGEDKKPQEVTIVKIQKEQPNKD